MRLVAWTTLKGGWLTTSSEVVRSQLSMGYSPTQGNVLITGATGYLGRLISATLLARAPQRLLLPVRPHHHEDEVRQALHREAQMSGEPIDESQLQRVTVLPVDHADLTRVLEQAKAMDVQHVLHFAGCVDYSDPDQLQEINVGLTRRLLELSKRISAQSFCYVSTAFSSGFIDGPIREEIPPEPESDPTDYTRSKRQAERLVADSGLPFTIVRPAIVIGDSRTGRYSGKPYGVYQLWAAMERLYCSRYLPEIHAVAPSTPLHLVHQDAFREAFWNGLGEMSNNSFLNLVSRQSTLPTVREGWQLFLDVYQPESICFYEDIEEVDLDSLESPQRILLEFAQVNLEISAHPWEFDRTTLEQLIAGGTEFPDVTVDTLKICQDWFFEQSSRLPDHLATRTR